MTLEEFKSTNWGANMKAVFEGEERPISSVNFNQALIGFSTPWDDELDWARCENVELLV